MIYDIDVGKLSDKDDKNNNFQYHLKICDSLDVIPCCLVTAPPPLPPARSSRGISGIFSGNVSVAANLRLRLFYFF